MRRRRLAVAMVCLSTAACINAPERVAEVPLNGGAESGFDHWEEIQGDITISTDAYEELKAFRFDGGGAGATMASESFAIEPNTGYRVSAKVKQLGGMGGYKVAIVWRTADGDLISIANDWAGDNAPQSYTAHIASATSPGNAHRASIELGVTAGAVCLFDEIRLTIPPPIPDF